MFISSKSRRRLGLAALALFSLTLASLAPLALAANYPNFEPVVRLGPNPPPPFPGSAVWDLRLRPRNIDNNANIVGGSNSGNVAPEEQVIMINSGNPHQVAIITGNGFNPNPETGNGRNPRLDIDAQGTSYVGFVWLPADAGYRGYMTIVNPNLQVVGEQDIGSPNRWQGNKELRLPDIRKSPTTGKLYITGEAFSLGDGKYYWYFGESSDNGQNVTGQRDLVGFPRDAGSSASIISRACVAPNDNLFMAARFGSGIALASRVDGVWANNTSLLTPGNNGGATYRYDLEIACAPDGTAYVVYTDSSFRVGLTRYRPGVGWEKLATSLFSGQGQADGNDVTVTPDGRVWVNGGITINGSTVQSQFLIGTPQANGNISFEGPKVAMSIPTEGGALMRGVGMRASNQGRIHVGGLVTSPRSSYYTSTDVEVVPPGPTPPAITSLNFNDEGSQMTVNWQDRSNDENGFTIQRRPKGSSTWATVGNVAANITTFSETVPFPQNTVFEYQVIATSGSGQGVSALAEILVEYKPDIAPTNPAVTPLSSSSIRVNWQDVSGVESGFVIERSLTGGGWVQAGETNANVTTFTDNNLSYGVTYNYRVRNKRSDLNNYVSPPSTIVATTPLRIRRLDIVFPTPINQTPDTPFAVQPIVTLRDINGQSVSNYTGPLVISIASGPAGATLGGNATSIVASGNSVIDFGGSNLRVNKVGTYLLRASIDGYSQTFGNFAVGAKFEYVTPASGVDVSKIVNEPFTLTAKVTDASGNGIDDQTFGDAVELSLDPLTAQNNVELIRLGSSIITGTPASDGVVTFTNLKLTNLAQGLKFKLRPLNGGTPVLGVQSSPLVNVVGILEISQPTPNPAKVNTYFKLVVTVKDVDSAPDPYNGPIILTNNGGEALSGVTMVNAINGVATFNSLIVLKGDGSAISNYTVQATIPGNATSLATTSFNLDARDNCDGLVVNAESGTDNWTSGNCAATVTLAGALGRATSGDTVVISPTLNGGNAVTIGLSADLNVPAGVSIEAGCTGTGPRLALTGSSNLTLNGNQTLRGAFLNGIKPVLAANAAQIRFSCFRVSR
jgi:Fibronectin type III domain